MDSQKLSYEHVLKLIDGLMYNITTTHLDMGGEHKYSLRHGAFPIISEIKCIISEDIVCKKCEVLEKILECKEQLLVCYRVQRNPSEKLWSDLEKYNKMLKEMNDER
jgi:hypothetical protein